ncbi:hypothetical protein GCM10022224_036270 [Nonomuraea antimicrobica]|uniref:Uncharacterized protein n=1 Tax=Nonomuraea antimicrobica TaxID=561173 RepID=A0ABP7BVG2_9ACTN
MPARRQPAAELSHVVLDAAEGRREPTLPDHDDSQRVTARRLIGAGLWLLCGAHAGSNQSLTRFRRGR